MPAPICVFAYARLLELQQTLQSLGRNNLAPESDLFIFVDKPETPTAAIPHDKIVEYCKDIPGFRSVSVTVSASHRGLAGSIIPEVTGMLERHGRAIVVEDDLITSPNFLDFMNAGLEAYADNSRVFSISGYTSPLPSLDGYRHDVYSGYRASSWGWATWKHQWREVDWSVADYAKYRWSLARRLRLRRGGSDIEAMLRRQMRGKIDSWAVRWCYAQSRLDRITIFPRVSKVKNIGFGSTATHTVKVVDFTTTVDDSGQTTFKFPAEPTVDLVLAREFRAIHSYRRRLARWLGF